MLQIPDVVSLKSHLGQVTGKSEFHRREAFLYGVLGKATRGVRATHSVLLLSFMSAYGN